MSAKATKIFGMNVGVDPKVIVLALLVIAGAIYYFTSQSETPSSGSSSGVRSAEPARPAVNPALSKGAARRADARNDRVLKLVPVDGSRGDVDPTLRLELLERVRNVPPAEGLRNLFEAGAPVVAAPVIQNAPKIVPAPLPQQPVVPVATTPPPPPPFVISLKYYGFVKPNGRMTEGNRGFFMDGDNILIGGEGDMLEKRYLIVTLSPTMARLEDTQAKQGADLPVTPEAQPAQ